uniref:Uncharacterized protein n=1 Tax=Meloidogyne enterolobii TaxID=390850 RepID=A0A6V7X072_MELEN|nr:unnamed protein product [Meloidogyne enterolobii]
MKTYRDQNRSSKQLIIFPSSAGYWAFVGSGLLKPYHGPPAPEGSHELAPEAIPALFASL